MKRAKLLFILFSLCTTAGFAQWNSDPGINLQISGNNATDLQSIRTQDGKTWIAYYKQVGSQYQMRAQLLDTAGNKLLGSEGISVDSLPSGTATYVFNIALDSKDNLIVGLQDQRLGASTSTVGYEIDQSGASLWNGANGVVLGDGFSPYPVALKSGYIAFAWIGNNSKINIQLIDSNGLGVWPTPVQIIPASGNSTRAQLVPMSDSGFIAVYQVYSFGINSTPYAQRYSKDGIALWPAPVQLSNEATSAVRYYSLKNENDTAYLGYWTSNTANHFNSWLQRINPDGTLPYGINGAAFSDYAGASDPLEMGSEINFEPGDSVVWAVATMSDPNQNQYGVSVQKFKKSDGTRLLNPLGKVVYPINNDRWAQQGGLALKDGKPIFMVAEDINYHIKATVLDDSGNFLMTPPDVDLSTTNGGVSTPKGRFEFSDNVANFCVAVWTEYRGGGNPNAFAQRFSLNMLDTSIVVSTENNVAPEITTSAGTLQMEAVLQPSSLNQDVVWSVINESGEASISNSGLLTAVSDGQVWVKAVSVVAPNYSDSLEVTISNQNTGINAVQNELGIQVYPNPASGIVTLNLTQKYSDLSFSVFDLSGRRVFSQQIEPQGRGRRQVNLSELASGTYLLQIKGKGLAFAQKIVLRR